MADDSESNTNTAGEEVDATAVEQSEASAPILQFALDVLGTFKTSRAQNGLRHKDYQRYRRFCTAKLRRLRRPLKIKYGRGKQFKYRYPKMATELEPRVEGKPVKVEPVVNDTRHLTMLLFMSERTWAYAMQRKSDSKDAMEPRTKQHVMRKLRKAAKFAEQFEKVAAVHGDRRTALEAAAYHAMMKGTFQFQDEDWKTALESFVHAKTVFEGLSWNEVQRGQCNEVIEEINNNIKYCKYQVQKQSGASESEREILEMSARANDLLAGKLEDLMNETRRTIAANMNEVAWRGQSLQVKTEKLRIAVLASQEAQQEINRAAAEGYDARIAAFDKVLGTHTETLQAVREETVATSKQQTNAKVQGQLENLKYLQAYITELQLRSTVERNLLMVADNIARLEGGVPGKKHARPEDIVHLYDVLLQNVTELTTALGVISDPEITKEMASKEATYHAFRCYWVGRSYATLGRRSEAAALYDRALTGHVPLALERHAACVGKDKESMTQLEALRGEISGQQAALRATQALEAAGEPLPGATSTETTPPIVAFPPQMEAIPCKPIFFDLAGNELSGFPDLSGKFGGAAAPSKPTAAATGKPDDKKPPQQQQGSGGWFSGWFGGAAR